MPTVQRSEVLHVVRELWGFKGGSVDDQAKLALAEELIREAWEHNNKMGIEVNNAGQVIKAALGAKWVSAHDRQAQGKPSLRQLLGDDPYFLVRVEEGFKQPLVKLRISRLAKLIGNPELIEEYRTPADGEDASTSHGHPQPQGGNQAVTLTDDGLPIRPGQRPCKHYMKFGWCLFKQDCWYSHPPNTTKRPSSRASAAARDPPLFESELEPGVMLINGVYPIRPGKKSCSFYINNGWCAFKAKCRSHHPFPSELEVDQASLSRAGTVSPTSIDSFDGGYAGSSAGDSPQVKQPPLQVLLGVIIDSVWPPSQSAEACARGAVAKFMVELQAEQVQRTLLNRDAQITVGGPQAGERLNKFWRQQRLYDPNLKPWGKAMANMLEEDPLFLASRAAQPQNTFTLLLGQLIESGAKAASSHLSRMADIVWPPNSGKDAWLRGMLAKWLLQAGFEGGNGEVLRQVLAVGPGSPTVFRIDVAQAGEFLKRSWERDPHPYDKSTPPWAQLKPLIAEDRFFYIEPAPGKPTSQHVTLDLLDLLLKFPGIARRSSNGGMLQVSGPGTSTSAASNGAGPSSSATAAPAGPSSSSSRGDALNVEDYEDSGASSNPAGDLLQASAAAAAAVGADGAAAAVEADIAALETLRYAPPPEGMGARKLQRWWPRNKPDQQGWAWAEVAVRLLSPDDPDAALRVAEMVQHLEICPILGVACSAYAQRPHLLQFFAPYASIGGLEMPAAVYLLDIHRPGEHVRNYLSLVAPVLSNRDNIKVCHSSKQWSGLLYQAFGMRLNHYVDTQQANYVWKSLMRETSKRPLADVDLQRTAEVSLTALLDTCGFYHPVRHNTDSGKLQWQNRPLTNELITCAAADVAYLLPLMETQVRTIRQAASDVRQHQSQQHGRAAQMLSSLPPELAGGSVIESLAQGVEGQQRGGLSLARLAEWASLNAFHQVPWHPIDG